MIRVRVSSRRLRVLDFDIENRPLAYLGSDFTSAEVTAIACSWTDESKVHCWMLGDENDPDVMGPITYEYMLESFRKFYDEAYAVTGHYVRKHDLPILNGAMMEAGLGPLGPKMVCDTHQDLVRRKGISASQESLAAMLGLPEPKHHMAQAEWRAANRLTPEGIAYARRRVVKDVQQHKALLKGLNAIHALKPMRAWTP